MSCNTSLGNLSMHEGMDVFLRSGFDVQKAAIAGARGKVCFSSGLGVDDIQCGHMIGAGIPQIPEAGHHVRPKPPAKILSVRVKIKPK